MNEVEILSRLHHPNLVTLYGCTTRSSRELLLVFEFVPNGTVADHLHGPLSSENALTWPVRLSVAIETANALAYLHAVEPPIIHRDVKTNNILLDDDFHVKVGDFGLSRLFPLDVTHVSTVPQGTPGYVDPVYYQCYHLTDKSDVYSFGVVLMELISSKQAVDLSRSKDEINLGNMALNKIQRCQLDELVDPALEFRSSWEVRCMVSLVAELAFRCLQLDREMRPSIKEVLETLRVIEKGDYNGDKMVKENMMKEETYLLKGETNHSSDTMADSWKSSSTTPNTSG
ncbi:LEAF RUST 10 DISEASE-RESISTANCE LOCUS RECEPTOR-LIKE PROTEIN KINASE-like 1.1 isoform X2 [Carex rostrata]